MYFTLLDNYNSSVGKQDSFYPTHDDTCLFPLLNTFQNRTSIIKVPKWENGMILCCTPYVEKRTSYFDFMVFYWFLWLLIKYSIIWWIRWPRFKFWLFHLLAAWTWIKYITFLSLNLLISERVRALILISVSCFEG